VTMGSGAVFEARALVVGRADGRAVVLEEALSFWGGLDPATGRVIDRRHPQVGTEVAGRILVMPSGRGSSSSSSVLAEAIRLGTAPAGIILREPDGIVALGAMVAREMYGAVVPVVALDPRHYRMLRSGAEVLIDGTAVSQAPTRR
jgi:predicted aconitase with swiveling domain